MNEVSSTRLYLGNLPRTATKADVEAHFATHGTGEITEIKLMSGFGFIEYKDAMDARDVVPAFHGTEFMGERLTVQFARGPRRGDGGNNPFPSNERNNAPRPRRTPHRMQITGLPSDTSWQDLKDFARQSGLDVVYSETGRNGSTDGFVEFETANDLRVAVEKLDAREFKGHRVTCSSNPDIPRGDRGRSLSPRRPHMMRGGPEDYDRRGPPRGYSPRHNGYRDGYRERSPPPRRDYYDDRARAYRSPPRRGPPIDDYPPPRGRYDDIPPYGRAPREYAPEPYMNGHGRGFDRRPPPPDFPPRDPYPREAYAREYDRRY